MGLFDLATAGFLPAALIALLGGLLSFLSPCVLPIVPPYLAYMAGSGVNDLKSQRKSAVVPSLMFVLGLSTVFLMMGAAASTLGRALLQYQLLLSRASGVVIIILGLHMLGIFRIRLLDREARIDADRPRGVLGPYVLGLAFAFGWTPCIGPALGMILSLAAQSGTTGKGTVLLMIYALGLGIPFILSAVFLTRAMHLMDRIKPWMGIIERVMGGLLILVGLALVSGAFSAFSYWLLETFPALARLG